MPTEYETFKACCVGCERKEVESCSIEEPCEVYEKALLSKTDAKNERGNMKRLHSRL